MQGSSSIFDPLGLITPVTIQAKILLQGLWKQHIDWDEPLEENFQNRWIKIIQEIREATELVIPRRYLLPYNLLYKIFMYLLTLALRHMEQMLTSVKTLIPPWSC